MFDEIKIYAIAGIILILGIGYFVYLIYQDLIFLKKGLKSGSHENDHEDYQEDEQEFIGEEDYDEEEEESGIDCHDHEDKYEDFSDDKELETHLNSLVEIEEPTMEVQEPKKKRGPKKKLETIEEVQEIEL